MDEATFDNDVKLPVACTTLNNPDGTVHVGPARTYLCMVNMEETAKHNTTNWPKGTELEASYNDAVVTFAGLLGASIRCGTDDDPNWTRMPWHTVERGQQHLFGQSAVEVAEKYIARTGRWLAYNKQEERWELVRI